MQFIDLKKQQNLIKKKIENRVQNVLGHGKYIMGPEVYELEEKLSSFANRKHCISCSSGTDALLIPLMALNIGPGDAVLTTTFSYIATSEVIRLLGATPIFIDIYEKTFNMNPALVKNGVKIATENNLNPKALIAVDLFGLPARYRLIKKECEEYNLTLIEDAAQGFGGKIGDQPACSFGDISSTSFFPAKPLGCYGDGGAIFTNDDDLAEIMKSIRVHGSGKDKYDNIRTGINGRLDTFQAAILLEKLNIFPEEVIKRNQKAKIFSKNISDVYVKPFIPKNYTSSWAQYSILALSNQHRAEVIKHLSKKNIPAMIYYPIPLHEQTVNSDLKKGECPIASDISKRIFSIPMHPYLNDQDQQLIYSSLNEIE
jgi:UDP-2-acetamido-2-deoxy-ribo-hexuluronate aminotransferase